MPWALPRHWRWPSKTQRKTSKAKVLRWMHSGAAPCAAGRNCLALEDITPSPIGKHRFCAPQFLRRVGYPLQTCAKPSATSPVRPKSCATEKQQCRLISVYVRTGLFNPNDPRYSNSAAMKLEYPTAHHSNLLEATGKAAYRPSGRMATVTPKPVSP